ncbi:MAG: Cna B-type domain-containing protein, partial [Actinomycetaceae bacterium]|nr:Cna B-type domain-containing protein [Actinomycetaceae bacterium]
NSWEHTWYDLPKKNSGGTDYTYTVTETIPSTAPFSYESTSSSSTEVDSNNCPVITNTVTNTLKTADLTVTKNVTGDARDENDEFGFTITHGNGTTTVDAQHVQKKGDGTATTYAIPIGAQWTVTETGLNGYTPTSCSATGGTCSGNTSASGTMTATGASVTFTNTKYMPPATGMTGGGTPATWILIATIGGVGAFLTFAFRRTSRH